MEWYFDDVTEKKSTGHSDTEKRLKERGTLSPHMEYYFDEITDRKYIRCPVTGRKATIEVIKSASRDHAPFVALHIVLFLVVPLLARSNA